MTQESVGVFVAGALPSAVRRGEEHVYVQIRGELFTVSKPLAILERECPPQSGRQALIESVRNTSGSATA